MTNAAKSLLLAVLAFFIMADSASACFAPPPELIKHHSELVADSRQIVWARALEPSNMLARLGLFDEAPSFKVIEVLKGAVPAQFRLPNGRYAGSNRDNEYVSSDFDKHRDLSVWDHFLTRQWNNSMCEMEPVFEAGESYLIFLDHPHWRAYEIVRSQDDLWLTAVRNLIEHPGRPSGTTIGTEDWLAGLHGVFVGRISNCQARVFEVAEILKGDFDSDSLFTDETLTVFGRRKPCEEGEEYLILTYGKEPSPYSYYDTLVVDIDDGRVDLTEAIDGEVVDGTKVGGTELEVTGQRVLSLEELRELLE